MVVENTIRLREIKSAILEDNNIFENIQTVSISTIDRALKRHQMSMKQLYTVPSERNGERVKELRYQHVQRIMEREASEKLHNFICMDEAGFNLTKCRRRGRNIIGHRATVDVPGQRGGNITMDAAISENGVVTHSEDLIPEQQRGQTGENLSKFVIVWANVSFHRSNIIRQWFATHKRMLMEFLSLYSSFINPSEDFFSAWRSPATYTDDPSGCHGCSV